MADTITLHYANVDTATAPYNEILKTTVAAYSGYGSVNIRVYDPQESTELEGETTNYANGEIRGSLDMRGTFELVVVPFTYQNSAWDVGDLETIITALRKKYKWLELTTYGSAYGRATAYHDATKVIPVELISMERSNDRARGVRMLTLKFAKVWQE